MEEHNLFLYFNNEGMINPQPLRGEHTFMTFLAGNYFVNKLLKLRHQVMNNPVYD